MNFKKAKWIVPKELKTLTPVQVYHKENVRVRVELPEDLTGIVEMEYQGKVVQGYYQQADYNFTKSQSSKVTLIVKNLNSL